MSPAALIHVFFITGHFGVLMGDSVMSTGEPETVWQETLAPSKQVFWFLTTSQVQHVLFSHSYLCGVTQLQVDNIWSFWTSPFITSRSNPALITCSNQLGKGGYVVIGRRTATTWDINVRIWMQHGQHIGWRHVSLELFITMQTMSFFSPVNPSVRVDEQMNSCLKRLK